MNATKSTAGLAKVDSTVQDRLDALMSRNTEGTLTAKEKRELKLLVEKVELLSLENACQLALRSRGVKAGPASPARSRKVPA